MIAAPHSAAVNTCPQSLSGYRGPLFDAQFHMGDRSSVLDGIAKQRRGAARAGNRRQQSAGAYGAINPCALPQRQMGMGGAVAPPAD